jgi:hypothetical protein
VCERKESVTAAITAKHLIILSLSIAASMTRCHISLWSVNTSPNSFPDDTSHVLVKEDGPGLA